MADFAGSIRRAALSALEAAKTADVFFGTVLSVSPLRIGVEQRLTLEAGQLILTRNVTDYGVDMSVSHFTENETEHTHGISDTFTGGGSSSPTSHRHDYAGRKRFTVHNGLSAGESVLLLRMKGGQKFIVWDRIV